jgi:7,8-dihydroneopterin aldolase/epimerase/oxygenase
MNHAECNLLMIEGLSCKTTIGVHDWEKIQPQTVVIDLKLELPFTVEAFEQDQLSGTVDYAAIVDDLKRWLLFHRCELLEYLAEKIAKRVLERYPILAAGVGLTKPGILPGVDRVTVYINRRRLDSLQS